MTTAVSRGSSARLETTNKQVKAQLATDNGGAAGRVLFIDTDDTFRTERVQEIAEASGVDAEQCMHNIRSTRAANFEMQCVALKAAANELADAAEGEYRLVVVDCVFRGAATGSRRRRGPDAGPGSRRRRGRDAVKTGSRRCYRQDAIAVKPRVAAAPRVRASTGETGRTRDAPAGHGPPPRRVLGPRRPLGAPADAQLLPLRAQEARAGVQGRRRRDEPGHGHSRPVLARRAAGQVVRWARRGPGGTSTRRRGDAAADRPRIDRPRIVPAPQVMAHNTNTKIFLKKAGRNQKKAVLQHSPFMPYGDCLFSITAAGIVDAVDG